MNKLDADITEWAEDMVNNCRKSEYSGINIVEKILRDPGITTQGSRHRVLWWPKTRRIARMSKAIHQIDIIARVCLIVRYGGLLENDGTIYTKYNLAKDSSVTVREFNRYVKISRKKLRRILKTYRNGVDSLLKILLR
jgi:hypothetical protein